jgi:hypothetical protein
MARRKPLSQAEILIAFFSTAPELDARALLLTAKTITEARFPPPAKIAQVKKPQRQRAKVAPVPAVATASPTPIGPGRRARPPIPAVATAAVSLPDQGTPEEAEA